MRGLLGNLAAAAIGLVVGVLLLEVALIWLIPPPLHYVYPQTLYDVDHDLGWVMKPNQHAFTVAWPVVTNSLGLRSAEISAVKKPAVTRCLCLGDSTTFGNAVAQEATYPSRVQEILSATDRTGPEVINAGVGGYNTLQEVGLMERLVPTIRPQIVVIGFFINDIGESLRTNNDKIVDAATGEPSRRGWKRFTPFRLIYALKRSRLVTLLQWKLAILRAGKTLDNEIFMGRTPPAYEEGWRRIEVALGRARQDAVAGGYRLIVFPVPAGQEFLADLPNEQYRPRLLAMADRLGIEHFDPTPVMKAAGGGFDTYFVTWDGHISARSHDIIAHMLADTIVSGSVRRNSPSPLSARSFDK